MGDEIHRHVSLVILPIDEFTGKRILSPDFLVRVQGAACPIIKQDGYRVFVGEFATQEIIVMLEGRFYRKKRITVDLSGIEESSPVVAVPVLPDRDYAFPSGTFFMEGRLPEGALLWAAGCSAWGMYRLSRDCEVGDMTLSVFRGGEEKSAGRGFLLTEREGEGREWVEFDVSDDFMQSIYRLKRPVRHPHGRVGTNLYPLLCYEADAMGTEYFIAFPGEKDVTEISVRCRLLADNGTKEYEFFLKTGEIFYWDF